MNAISRIENGALFRKISLWYMGGRDGGDVPTRQSPPSSPNRKENQTMKLTKNELKENVIIEE